jgi:hypothetical protein
MPKLQEPEQLERAELEKWIYQEGLTDFLSSIHGNSGERFRGEWEFRSDPLAENGNFFGDDELFFEGTSETFDRLFPGDDPAREAGYTRAKARARVVTAQVFAALAAAGTDYLADRAARYAAAALSDLKEADRLEQEGDDDA